MKWIISLFLPALILAEGTTMSYEEHRQVQVKNSRQHNIHHATAAALSISKLTFEDAKKIAQKETGEKPLSVTIGHESLYLLFYVITQGYRIDINALDGSIYKKETR